MSTRYSIHWQSPARRAVAEGLPSAVATAVIEFVQGALAENPHRVGKPLVGKFAGYFSARRGDYRVIYRVDEAERTVVVVRVDHRRNAYR